MKHFIGFVITIFLSLTLFYFYKDDNANLVSASSLKVYGSSSFVGSWGPGPKLKELFEAQTGLKITYLEMADPSLTLQKMALDGEGAVGDVVLSLDQFDLAKSSEKISWQNLNTNREKLNIADALGQVADLANFEVYDWAPIAFVSKKNLAIKVENLNDLLKSELKGRIALEDPRTSSPGLNFLAWVFEVKGLEEGKEFLRKLMNQAHSFSPSWSAAYGLFKNNQTDLVLSYSTSPLYHLIEEKDDNYQALEFSEGHVIQAEFAGVPQTCKNCEGGLRFIKFLKTPEAQKIIMEKNYMFPLDKTVQESTPFDANKVFKLRKMTVVSKEQVQNYLKIWSELKKEQPN